MGPQAGPLPGQKLVKVSLDAGDVRILDALSQKMGWSHSEIMRTAFRDYVKDLSLLTEEVHR